MATNKNITMKQFNGTDYDTLYPKTIASQVDGVYSKDEILANTTKTLYGLDSSATPNDVFALIGNGWIPSGKGILVIKAVDSDGNEVSDATFTITPAINSTSNFSTNAQGKICLIVDPGTYTISTNSDIFISASPTSTSITIEDGIAKISNFTVTKITSGEVDITKSTSIFVPSWVTNIDLFAVGGGASGKASLAAGTPLSAAGGAGGYTATLLSQKLSGKLLKISIGAGGKSVTVTGNNASGMNDGGNTKITVNEKDILIANGGKGTNGGSGGGVADDYNKYQGNGGSDGSDGENGGTGQGTTTRKFGEKTNTLYSGGGGGADADRYTQYKGVGGKGGGGDGTAFYTTTAGTYTGKSGTTYGGGGGGICVKKEHNDTDITLIAGAGYQGLVSLRW